MKETKAVQRGLSAWVGMTALLSLLTVNASPTIAVIGYWRMGEDDPAPSPELPSGGQRRAKDRVSPPHDLNLHGTPSRSGQTQSVALSETCMAFDPATGDFGARDFLPTSNCNVGLEVWARSDGPNENSYVVYNGDGGNCGYGFQCVKDQWSVFFGGYQGWPVAPVEPGKWTHLALILGEKDSAVYINEALAATIPRLPNPPERGVLMVGGQADGRNLFRGALDEIRLFTFSPGGFQPSSDLLVAREGAAAAASPNPSPSSGETAKGIAWMTDPRAAADYALAGGRNLCLFTYSSEFRDCDKTLLETFGNAEVQKKLRARYVCLKLDVEQHANVIANFKIFRAGSVLVVTPAGTVLSRFDKPYVSADELIPALSQP